MAKEPREVVLAREQQVWALRQQLWTHERIARELGVDRSTVTKILARLSARYAKRQADQVDAVKGEQLAALERIADEALQAWEASKRPTWSVTRNRKHLLPKGEGAVPIEVTDVTRRVDYSLGNPAHLGEARAALADIRKILGLDAPTKLAGADGGELELVKVYLGVDLERI